MAFYQNEKKQLNAGQLREVVKLFLNAIKELYPTKPEENIMAKKMSAKKATKKVITKKK